tara:strand:- start:3350 stop:3922 length:573 start_codon:yes stop_codon:yes gene_type:complete
MSQVTRSNFQWHFSVENLNNVNVPISQSVTVQCPPKALILNQSTPQRASSIGLGRLRRCLVATSSVAVFVFVITTVTLIVASTETADNSTLEDNSHLQFDLRNVPSDRDTSDNELLMSAITESVSFKLSDVRLQEDKIDRSILHVLVFNENGHPLEELVSSKAFEKDVARLSGFVALEVTNVVLSQGNTP